MVLFHLLCFSQTWNWAKEVTLSGDPYGFSNCIASDDSGNIYFAEASQYSLISMLKFDKTGSLIWEKSGANSIHTKPTQFIAYCSNYEYWAGNFTNSNLIFGMDTLSGIASYGDVFITKYNTAGVLQWARQSKSLHLGSAVAYADAADGLGNSYITGLISDTVIFGADTLKSYYGSLFLVKYAPNGNLLWAKKGSAVSSSYLATPLSVSADNAGNAYIGGYYSGSVIFGSDTLPMVAPPTTNAFLVKYDPAGNVLWAWWPKITSGWKGNHIQSVSCDVYGNAYITGTFKKGKIVMGIDTFSTTQYFNPFLAKFNPSGTLSWAKQVYELDNNAWGVISVAVDTMGNGCLCLKDSGANTALKIKLGSDTLSFNFGNNGFLPEALFQFDSAGNVNCGTMFAEQNEDDGDGICISPSGKYMYVAGDVETLSYAIFGKDTLYDSSNINEPNFIGSWQPCSETQTSVNSNYSSADVKIYPNQGNGVFTFEFNHAELVPASYTTVEIYNVMGQKVMFENLKRVEGDNLIDLSNEPNGIYFYRVLQENRALLGAGKLVIQK